MRKWLMLLALLFAAAVLFYFLLPGTGPVVQHAFAGANQNTVYRCITDKSLLEKWWPGNRRNIVAPERNKITATYNDLQFTITAQAFDVVRVDIKQDAEPVPGFITILPLQQDSSLVTWKTEPPAHSGLFARLQHPLLARTLKQSMAGVLEHLQEFMQNEKNIYGMAVTFQNVTDTLLVVTRQRDTVKPTVDTYYGLIKKLQAYIATQGAQQTNYPMLHILKTDSTHYEIMVAIPVNKPVPSHGAILAKRMIPGNILVAEVKGGMGAVDKGMQQLEYYLNEHRLRPPALPFQSLVTDRLVERDTTKWITRLYYPVI